MSASSDEAANVDSLNDKLAHLTNLDAVQGKVLYSFFNGAVRVLEQTTTAGRLRAVKVRGAGGIEHSEAEMMQYASTHGVLAPKVTGFYEVKTSSPSESVSQVLVSERVEGRPLVDTWLDLSPAQQSSLKDQLRAQIARMRQCTQPFIGRIGNQAIPNLYGRFDSTFCGPFPDEKAFDKWCLRRVGGNPLVQLKWRKFLASQRKSSSDRFVLTHGDLTPRNIMVNDQGVITGIVDWENSGFYPEYAEYAFAMVLGHSHEEWWIPILKEVLQPCSKERLEFTGLVEDTRPGL